MALDPQFRDVLVLLRALGLVGFDTLTVSSAREAIAAVTALQGEPEPVREVREVVVPGPVSGLAARVYQPERRPVRPRPLIVYFHGGGFVLGDLELADRPCRALANAAGAVVASVAYRKAPEAPFPAAVLDAQVATRWFAEHAGVFNADPARIGVAGDDAGANLAAVVAQQARRTGEPVIAVQLLVCPSVDFAGSWPSRAERMDGGALTGPDLEWFTGHYLGADRGAVNLADPLLSPLRAGDLSGLPPAILVTAGLDPLRDEGRAYAEALGCAGVPVLARHEELLGHGLGWLAGHVRRAREVITELGEQAHQVFASATTAVLHADPIRQDGSDERQQCRP